MKNKEVQELEKKLTYTRESAWKSYSEKQKEKIFAFADKYKSFLDEGKTERECVEACISRLEKNGFVNVETKEQLVPGDRVYRSIRNKGLVAAVIGTEPVVDGMNILGAHIDSPHIDLKPTPLYEDGGLALMKTHYYGGIKKYQWSTMPLAFHGIMYNSDGEKIRVNVGEDENDPVFMISELLVHLSQEQLARKASEAIKGEELNVLVGGMPMEDGEVKEGIKLAVLKLLNDKYGITEKDFMTAEIEMVPAYKAKDIGFDRSFVGAYGQDDRVCAYTAITAEMDAKKPAHTTVTILTDKEETGSDGNTGLNSDYVLHYIEDLAEQAGVPVRDVLRNSLCLSSDVNAAYDPTFPDVYEGRNSSYINKGCVLTKYTGARGKAGSNDASAETMAKVIGIMEEEGVYWQAGELGAVDAGGGGTIAKLVAHMNVDTVDLGVPILSMHSPFELSSKLDVYNTYKAFKAFYK